MPSHVLLRLSHYLRDRRLIDHTDRLHDEHLRPRDCDKERRDLGVIDPYCDRDVHLLVGDGVGSNKALSELVFTH